MMSVYQKSFSYFLKSRKNTASQAMQQIRYCYNNTMRTRIEPVKHYS